MASSTFFIPSVNVIGADSLTDAMNMMADYGFTRTLIVTDNMLTKLGMAGDVQKALEERNIFSVIYDGTQPNPTTENVAAGLKLLKENNCDSVISLGGGSPHDCAKGIALVAANGGDIRDYEGVDRSAKPQAADDRHQYHCGYSIRNDSFLHHHRRSASHQNGDC